MAAAKYRIEAYRGYWRIVDAAGNHLGARLSRERAEAYLKQLTGKRSETAATDSNTEDSP